MGNRIVELLYKTEAFKVSPKDRPFWYTSGKIGPFYINTHYLYGSAGAAEGLLTKIDLYKDRPVELTEMLLEETTKAYEQDPVYRELMDAFVAEIKENIPMDEIDFISGGERRDWFFSVQAARLLGKKHISIFKDLSMGEGFGKDMKAPEAEGACILHIADLITLGSSYERAWVPALEGLKAKMAYSYVIVDRMQGGGKVLEDLGVKSYSMVKVDSAFFTDAKDMDLINDAQLKLLMDYEADPDKAMLEFVKEHPEFMEKSLAGDPLYGGSKSIQRAKLCLEKGFYLTEK